MFDEPLGQEQESWADPAPSVRDPEERGHPLLENLSRREVEILGLLAQGRTNQEISKSLLVSVSTVKKHVQHVIRKLRVSDRTQAAVRAVELGLRPEE